MPKSNINVVLLTLYFILILDYYWTNTNIRLWEKVLKKADHEPLFYLLSN